jgi:hypothetical protein
MSNFKLLFSEYFEILESKLEKHGALNICLSADLPLFIDPFLLFASEKKEYKKLHNKVVNHLVHLKEVATIGNGSLVNAHIFEFPEIKQNWLGMSKYGNGGKGLGKKFAASAIKSFNGFYSTFGDEKITDQTHIEKLTLLNSGIGKDFISDFTTNLILDFLLTYTEKFARKNLQPDQCKEFSINSIFNYELNRWTPKIYKLPYFFHDKNGDFIILTPIDILSKDDAIINNSDFVGQFKNIPNSIGDSSLRQSINDFFKKCLPKKPKRDDINDAILKTVNKFPDLIDYYIKLKEDKKENLKKIPKAKIDELINELVKNLSPLCEKLLANSEFYSTPLSSYEEALKRVHFLKDVIENNDGYRIFYVGSKPISKEDTVQRIFRLTWYASPYDVNAEVNNGRGPADYKVSFGSGDSTIVEFKLGKSSSLKRNLENQTEIYKKASKSINDISVILCYTSTEINRVGIILKELKIELSENIVVIDASPKKSASTI